MKTYEIKPATFKSIAFNILLVLGAFYAETIIPVSHLFKFVTWMYAIILIFVLIILIIADYVFDEDKFTKKEIKAVNKLKTGILGPTLNAIFYGTIIVILVANGWIGYGIVWTLLFAIEKIMIAIIERLKEKAKTALKELKKDE